MTTSLVQQIDGETIKDHLATFSGCIALKSFGYFPQKKCQTGILITSTLGRLPVLFETRKICPDAPVNLSFLQFFVLHQATASGVASEFASFSDVCQRLPLRNSCGGALDPRFLKNLALHPAKGQMLPALGWQKNYTSTVSPRQLSQIG